MSDKKRVDPLHYHQKPRGIPFGIRMAILWVVTLCILGLMQAVFNKLQAEKDCITPPVMDYSL